MTAIEKEKALLKNWRSLPADKQQKALEFIESMNEESPPKRPLRSALGIWKDLNITVTEEDIAQVRKEMWANFPRDIEL